MIGFWISMFLFSLSSFFVFEQFAHLRLQKKTQQFIQDNIKIYQTIAGQVQRIEFMRSGSYEKKGQGSKSKRKLVTVPVSLSFYLEPNYPEGKRLVEKILETLFFSQRPKMQETFLKKIREIHQKNGQVTIEDILHLRFSSKNEQSFFQKVLMGSKTRPSFFEIFSAGGEKKMSVYHLPKQLLPIFFSAGDIHRVEHLIEAYKTGEENMDQMLALLKRAKLEHLFSEKILHQKQRQEYIKVSYKGKNYFQRIY